MTNTAADQDQFGLELNRRLRQAEHALDIALAETNELTAFMTRGRIDNQIPAVFGQDILLSMGSLSKGLTKSRRHLIDAHGFLKRDARKLNIGWRLGGPAESPGDDAPVRPILLEVKAA